MQEELERKSISVTVQAAKLTGRVMRAAVAAALRKIEKERNTPKVGRNSMRRLTAQTPDAHKIEVEDRIRSFERYAKKYKVRYHVEKDITVSPPKWTVYFKASQADAIETAFKKYTQKTVKRDVYKRQAITGPKSITIFTDRGSGFDDRKYRRKEAARHEKP